MTGLLKGFELTERGKITLAVLIVIPILILSIILAVLALRNTKSDTPPPEEAPAISAQYPNELVPQPPGNGGFAPADVVDPNEVDSHEVSPIDSPEGDVPDDESSGDGALVDEVSGDNSGDEASGDNSSTGITDVASVNSVGRPTLNLTAGKFSFYFSFAAQKSFDNETLILLDKFLASPLNVRSNTIAIETPKLSRDDASAFMLVMTSELGARNISTARVTHIVDPEIPLGEHFEVVLYYIEQQIK